MVHSKIRVCKITITSFVLLIHNHDNEYMANKKAWYFFIYWLTLNGQLKKLRLAREKFGEKIKILIIAVELQNVWQISW